MSDFQCGFCKRSFRNERTLAAHSCAVKRRHRDRDSVSSRMGLTLFQTFFQVNHPGSRVKTFDDFASSKYYTAFIKLARHLQDLRPIEQDRFVDWLFRNDVKERDWCKDATYERFIIDTLLKESTNRAMERSIQTMAEWCETSNVALQDFFSEVTPGEATLMIRYGRISPWVLYMADSADHLWSRLNDEQGDIIGAVIDPEAWRKKFETKLDDCQFVKGILDESGL